jgi:hypothetical protein
MKVTLIVTRRPVGAFVTTQAEGVEVHVEEGDYEDTEIITRVATECGERLLAAMRPTPRAETPAP